MLFGNTSLHDDVVLHDVTLPPSWRRHSVGRATASPACARASARTDRALTCSALKPQGLSPERLGALAERFARGGIDYIKDDHGLADQDYSRFADRVRACAAGVARATQATGHPTRYVPSLSGDLERHAPADRRWRATSGIDCVLLAPMIAGFATMQALVAEFPDVAFFAHPSLGGAARIAPALLIGTLFRLIGADAVIFPNFGGRFGYSPETCRQLADNARMPRDGLRPSLPVPAGGMTLQRVPELLDFYGAGRNVADRRQSAAGARATDRGDRRLHARRRGARLSVETMDSEQTARKRDFHDDLPLGWRRAHAVQAGWQRSVQGRLAPGAVPGTRHGLRAALFRNGRRQGIRRWSGTSMPTR